MNSPAERRCKNVIFHGMIWNQKYPDPYHSVVF